MNCVRYYLCLCILMNHFNILTQACIPALPRIFGGVGSFFAISGFLMFASYEKHHNLKGYLVRRARRILPPYVFIVILAALTLVTLSTLTLLEYFTSAGFWKYLVCNLCFMNFMAPSLPGVFDGPENVINAVNGALWTMKGEVVCYLMVPVLFNVIRRFPRRCTLILAACLAACFSVFLWFTFSGRFPEGSLHIVAKQFRVFSFFLCGALINVHLKAFLRYKWVVFAVVLAMMGAAEINSSLYHILRPFSDSMLVIWCSLVGTWGVFASHRDSLSYDIYLFHFPIIQALVATGMIAALGSIAGLVLTVGLTVGLAIISWNFIDAPILNAGKKKRSAKTIAPA